MANLTWKDKVTIDLEKQEAEEKRLAEEAKKKAIEEAPVRIDTVENYAVDLDYRLTMTELGL